MMTNSVKGAFIIVAVLMLYGVMGCSGQLTTTTSTEQERGRERNTTTTEARTTTTASTTTTTQTNSRQQEAYLAFESKFLETEQPAREAAQNLIEVLDRAQDNQATRSEVIAAAQEVKRQSEIVSRAYTDIEVPDILAGSIKNLLEQSKSDMSKAYSLRAEAIDSAIKAISNPESPSVDSHLQNFEEKSKEAEGLVSDAANNLIKARRELGLPTQSSSQLNLYKLWSEKVAPKVRLFRAKLL